MDGGSPFRRLSFLSGDVRPKTTAGCPASDLNLDACLEDVGISLKLFLNNKFTEAKERMQPHAETSMYHALGYGTIMYIQAVMTFDMGDIEAAIQAIKRSVIVCSKHRKRTSMIGSITKAANKTDYNSFTEDEMHAELCYAECLLIRALLTFIQDENLISFVKGGLKIRECYKIYKECNKMLVKRKWDGGEHKIHFESGVKMGVGAFNLMISLLPSKIMKLLEFVGFSGNKKLGLAELHKGSEVTTSLRGPLCSIMLIAYHTVVTFVLGLADGDIDYASELLKPCLRNFPKGALFLFFAGRVEEVRGNIDEAVYKFEESIDSQSEWRQFHHLCFWELMWCHCFKGDWLIAMKYAERLCRESRWSKATYTYQKASFLMMCDDQTEETHAHISFLFSEVPRLKQRIAGKSLPFEKFAVAKANRFVEQDGRLTLPALELIYVWNGFNIIGKKMELLEPMLMKIEEVINEILQNKGKYHHFHDDYSLALLLKGVCLRHRGQAFQAEQCFKEILSYESNIKIDTYLVPYAFVEVAILYLQEDRLDEVKKMLEKAKKNYKGYYLESRLHFRIHAIRLQLESANSSDAEASSAPQSPAPQSPSMGSMTNSFDYGPDDVPDRFSTDL
ncbi:tetratricopeptide repeat protein 39B-like isoform X1 [Haliotis rufescens]|uniref:tetratricopeptide repeat protein 39B-like isoform X1 n=1 Tax=Haliotis rufescens TaxID=6454 RepID=UPI001EAFF8E9|nr:tetratricopeptide repeat protein 39B-like isoform X1 [Haliotis rufescens]